MTNHHHPDPADDEPATDPQQRYLRVLAQRSGQTFVPPRSKAHASEQITRMRKAERNFTRVDRYLDDRHVSDALAGGGYGVGIREGETTTTGYGAAARWA